jgi:hypothetical protein
MIEACNPVLIIWCRCAFWDKGSMSNRAQQSIDDGSMTAIWAVVDNGWCLETPPDNGVVVRQKGGLVGPRRRPMPASFEIYMLV